MLETHKLCPQKFCWTFSNVTEMNKKKKKIVNAKRKTSE